MQKKVAHDFRYDPRITFTSTNPVAYLYFVIPLVHSQRQVDIIYFDFINSFDLVPHEQLLRKFEYCGLLPAYVTSLHSYLTNRISNFCSRGPLSTQYAMLSGVPQGSVLLTLLLDVFTNDLCSAVKYSNLPSLC